MAAAAAGDGGLILRGALEGSISGSHLEVQRRPYHRNCSCALHGAAKHCRGHHKPPKVSYPLRRSWSEGSLALYAAATASATSSPSASPVAGRALHLPPPHPHSISSSRREGDHLFPSSISDSM